MDKVTAIIVAGGSGKRMGTTIKKQYIPLKGKEVLAHTLQTFEECKVVDEVIVVVSKEEIDYIKEYIIEKYNLSKVKKVVPGGKERQDSVYNGLMATGEDSKYVMIHDGARPFIKKETILEIVETTKNQGAAIVAVPVKDTIKVINLEEKTVEATPNRASLWSVQTPQSFERELLIKAYKYASERNLQVTDDSMLVEAYGHGVHIVEGDYTNIKITTPEDLIIGEAILGK